MLEAEVVEREPQSEHRLVIRHRLGMGIGQPRESSDVHSAGQVEPLHAAGAYLGSLDLAADLFRFHSHYRSRVILLLLLLGRGDERLHYLGEVDFAIPRLRDDRRVGCKPVRKDRRASGDAGMETVGEDLGMFAISFPDVIANQGFRVAIHRGKRVAIPFVVHDNPAANLDRPFLRANKRPLLVDFDRLGWHVVDALVQERGARLACLQHQAKDGIAVDARQSLDGSDGHSFQQHYTSRGMK